MVPYDPSFDHDNWQKSDFSETGSIYSPLDFTPQSLNFPLKISSILYFWQMKCRLQYYII
jgi:hypothetical protein